MARRVNWRKLLTSYDKWKNDPIKEKYPKLKEQYSEYVKRFYNFSGSYDKAIKNGEIHESLRYLLSRVRQTSKIRVLTLPPRDALLERIKAHAIEGSIEFVDESGNKITVSEATSLDEVAALTNRVRKGEISVKGEGMEYYKAYTNLLGIHANTAYVTNAYDPETRSTVFFIGVGSEFIDSEISAEGDDVTKQRKLTTVIAHEFQHIHRGDLKEENMEKYPHMGASDLNVVYDAAINSDLLRRYPKDAYPLFGKGKYVNGDTLHKFGKAFFIVEAIKNLSSPDVRQFIQNYIDIHERMVGQPPSDDELAHLANIQPDALKKAFDKVHSATVKDHMREIRGKWDKKLERFVKQEFMTDETLGVFNQAFEGDSFLTFLQAIQQHMQSIEANRDKLPLSDFWADIWDKVSSFLPEMPEGEGEGEGGGGGGGRGKGSMEDGKLNDAPDDLFDDFPDDEVKSAEFDAGSEIRDIQKGVQRRESGPGRGQMEVHETLKPTRNKVIKAAIKNALTHLTTIVRKKLVEKILPVTRQDVAFEYATQDVKRGKTPGSTPAPRGIILSMPEEAPFKGLLIAVIDESGSMSNEDVAAAKTALIDLCHEGDFAVLTINMASDPTSAKMAAYNPKKRDTSKFLKRFTTGGTEDFHRVIFDFDKLMKNEEFKRNVLTALRDAGIEDLFGTGDLERDLMKMFEQGRIVGLAVSDGYIGRDRQMTSSDLQRWLEYAQKAGKPPLVYITTTGHFLHPFEASPEDRKKLYTVRSV